MKYPLVSIVVATLNSESTLPKLLSSIRKQNYPQKKIEILIIDGGSKDKTLDIARDYHSTIIPNPKVDLVFAKHIGYQKAKGELLLFLDSDEALNNVNSIRRKVLTMTKDLRVKVVISSGYLKPHSYPQVNFYLNEYGDPFSFFMYRSSRDNKYFFKELVTKFKVVHQDKDKAIFDFSTAANPPFIELISMGAMIDLKYVKKTFPKILTYPFLHIHLFYLLISKRNLLAIMKDDPVVHYSAATIKSYLKKIRSRVRNNIYGTTMGLGGFKGREKYYDKWYRIKKFLFIPYCLSIVFPLMDSLNLFLTRKKPIYFIHPFLCLYTLLLIVFYYVLKVVGVRPKFTGYGN